MTFSRLFLILKHIVIINLFPLSLQATSSTIETYNDFQKIFPEVSGVIKAISVSDQDAHIKGELLREKVMEVIENGVAEKKAKLIERFDIILKQFTAKNFLESHNDREIRYAQKASPYVMELREQFHKLSPGYLLFVNTDLPSIEDWFKFNADTEYAFFEMHVKRERERIEFFVLVDWSSVITSYEQSMECDASVS